MKSKKNNNKSKHNTKKKQKGGNGNPSGLNDKSLKMLNNSPRIPGLYNNINIGLSGISRRSVRDAQINFSVDAIDNWKNLETPPFVVHLLPRPRGISNGITKNYIVQTHRIPNNTHISSEYGGFSQGMIRLYRNHRVFSINSYNECELLTFDYNPQLNHKRTGISISFFTKGILANIESDIQKSIKIINFNNSKFKPDVSNRNKSNGEFSIGDTLIFANFTMKITITPFIGKINMDSIKVSGQGNNYHKGDTVKVQDIGTDNSNIVLSTKFVANQCSIIQPGTSYSQGVFNEMFINEENVPLSRNIIPAGNRKGEDINMMVVNLNNQSNANISMCDSNITLYMNLSDHHKELFQNIINKLNDETKLEKLNQQVLSTK